MSRRIVLGVLIFVNLATIFFFSHQDAKTSTAVSNAISHQIEIRTPDYAQKSLGEKNILHSNLQKRLRESAHTLLFFSLGILLYFYIITYGKRWYLSALYTVGIGFLCALGDEFHQTFVPGRTAQWSDVGGDMLGILLSIVILSPGVIVAFYQKTKKP